MTTTAKILETMYLDWLNNYLTVGLFAEMNGLTQSEAFTLVELGREVHHRIATAGELGE